MAKKGNWPSDFRKTRQFRSLRRSLLDNLAARGLAEEVYADKVEEYMDFWVRRRELQADIQERGMTVVDDRGRVSENRSISLEIQVSRQMLNIFTALGFKDDAIKGGMGCDGNDEL